MVGQGKVVCGAGQGRQAASSVALPSCLSHMAGLSHSKGHLFLPGRIMPQNRFSTNNQTVRDTPHTVQPHTRVPWELAPMPQAAAFLVCLCQVGRCVVGRWEVLSHAHHIPNQHTTHDTAHCSRLKGSQSVTPCVFITVRVLFRSGMSGAHITFTTLPHTACGKKENVQWEVPGKAIKSGGKEACLPACLLGGGGWGGREGGDRPSARTW